MQISERGKRKIAEFEELKTSVYADVGGLLTIGYGHLLTADELISGSINIKGQRIDYKNGLTEQQCLDLLDQDLDIAEQAVNDLVIVDLNQHQFDALVSFVFNIGVGAFAKSTLLRLLNMGAYDAVPAQMRRWIMAKGKVVRGLINRREADVKLWMGL